MTRAVAGSPSRNSVAASSSGKCWRALDAVHDGLLEFSSQSHGVTSSSSLGPCGPDTQPSIEALVLCRISGRCPGSAAIVDPTTLMRDTNLEAIYRPGWQGAEEA
jgi:hypothetical protein